MPRLPISLPFFPSQPTPTRTVVDNHPPCALPCPPNRAQLARRDQWKGRKVQEKNERGQELLARENERMARFKVEMGITGLQPGQRMTIAPRTDGSFTNRM
jgi:hypothetical protein